ncbi:hypothetical protein Fcan01_08615 [Folsomia candida]|uniref:Uncharacterized protein n=2 Tax=Folsomia candida TaxID=158441 RepID=A0A226EF19_FOLCA|nr:hypothetical protein Fcan01_08615 [Folsomia candida]
MDTGMMGGSFWSWPYFNCSSTKNRKIMTESELEIHTLNYVPHVPPEGGGGHRVRLRNGHHGNPHFVSGKNKRAAGGGHGVVHGHTSHIFQQLHKQHLQPKLDLENAWLVTYTAWFPIHVTKDK